MVLICGAIVITITNKDGIKSVFRVPDGIQTDVKTAPGTRIEFAEESNAKADKKIEGSGVSPVDGTASNFAIYLKPLQEIVVATPVLELNSDDPLTIEMWVQPDAKALEPTHWVLASVAHAYLGMQQVLGRPVLRAALFESGPGGVAKFTRGLALDAGRRVHAAMICEHNRVGFYANGKLVGTAEVQEPRPSIPIEVFRIGNATTHLSGLIYEVRLSRGVRYKKNFVPDNRLASDEETLVLFHCDEGTGPWLRDASGHGNDGRVNNGILVIRRVRADGTVIATD